MRESYDVLIVGAGHAGINLAAALRHATYEGTIGLIGAEEQLPYERPPLSKAFLAGTAEVDDFRLRSAEWFGENAIDLVPGVTVERVEPDAHQIWTESGRRVGYGSLVWAAGGRARRLSLPGSDLSGVLSLRTHEDAVDLRDRLIDASRAVIIGGGYIGLEGAAALAGHGVSVSLIEAQDRLLARVTCPVVSDFYAELHRANGARVHLAAGVERLIGEDGRVVGVEMTDGTVLDADLVIVGVGLIPNVEPLSIAGIEVTNGVDVDADFRTSAPDVFAIGDCANVAHPFALGARVRLESVPNAADHARALAAVMTGGDRPAWTPPWFWSHQFETKLQTVGLQGGHDEAALRGDPSTGRFSVVYLRAGRVIALDCVNTVGDFAQGKQLVLNRVEATAEQVADTSVPLKRLLDTNRSSALAASR